MPHVLSSLTCRSQLFFGGSVADDGNPAGIPRRLSLPSNCVCIPYTCGGKVLEKLPFPSKNWQISTYSIQKPNLVGDQSNVGFTQCHQQLQLKGIVFPLLGLCNRYIILAELN